ncbi:hypothetical protein LUZ61_013010 [Rhynchospora tenuis]|uniref:Uncharacterized protein n=1 Tax=Rhynchospora tenuis TaxID=198213 RepID=A0AAD6A473_9POAL|nr:hypothetical protein LUZ61_013010 [Rhynchospora tenuis]
MGLSKRRKQRGKEKKRSGMEEYLINPSKSEDSADSNWGSVPAAGHVPVLVGAGDDEPAERFVVKLRLLQDPRLQGLLHTGAANFGYEYEYEYEYDRHGHGLLRIHCQPHQFRTMLAQISKSKSRSR